MKKSRLFTFVIAVAAAFALLTASIAIPILFRPFYYLHIRPLALCEQTGLTEVQIRQAYDEMLDYCLGGEEFSTGVLRWSESGKSHFTDVRTLFLLDLKVLGLSAAVLLVCLILSKAAKLRPARPAGRGPGFWAGVGLGGGFLILGGLAALDFDRAFTLFHALFFPGKDNWLFDPRADEIINILPESFFRNCGILILALLVAGCAGMILADLLRRRRNKRSS